MRFYREAFGFRDVHELEVKGEPSDTLLRIKGVALRAIYLERDGTVIELLHFASPGSSGNPDTPRPLNRHGLTHLSFQVEDMETVLAEVARYGGRALDDTRIAVSAEIAAVFCTDPDGTLIELVQRADG